MIKKIFIMTIVLLLAGDMLYAQSKVGTTAANFLTIPVGTRASGMGGAFVAVANDVTASYWNPGGLSRLESSEFTAVHAQWLAGSNLNWFGVGVKLTPDDAVAVSVNQLDYGEEDITTEDHPNGTGQKWSAMDMAFSLSYARNLTDRFSIGANAKYVHAKIYNETASAFSLDVGLLFTTQFNGLRIGMNIANFGTDLKLDGKDLSQPIDVDPSKTGNNDNIVGKLETDSWPLPMIFTVGVGMDAMNNDMWKWTVATDAVYPNNHTAYLNFGTELTFQKTISVRGGYNTFEIFKSDNKDAFKEESEAKFTAGVGLMYDFGSVSTKFDFSYETFKKLGDVMRYSLTIGF